MRILFYLLLFLFSQRSFAIIFEPHLGISFLSQADTLSKPSLTFGAQVGKVFNKTVVGLEYTKTNFKFNNSSDVEFEVPVTAIGAYLVQLMTPTTKIYFHYFPHFKRGELSYTTGSAFGGGIGYRLFHKLFINAEYNAYSDSEFTSTSGAESVASGSSSEYKVTLSIPLNLF